MFNLYGNDRLTEWKRFRDSLEHSDTPFEDVAEFWSPAPFVSPYLNPQTPEDWPDPWHIVLDGKWDDLAISLGMLYTLKLTQRFMAAKYEIHMAMLPNKIEPCFWLFVDDKTVLNCEYKCAVPVESIPVAKTNKIWATGVQQ